MTGDTVLHYEIDSELGRGGMGVVYKAHDTKLKRDVAIKFLPPEIASIPTHRERLKVEAQAAAVLNHPNIAQVYAIEETDDRLFIVMECIEGYELGELNQLSLPPDPDAVETDATAETAPDSDEMGTAPGELHSLDTTLDYAMQIAAGLQAAHERGIVHRDIKSSNLMITRKGQVKIMDFGLAKIAEIDVGLTEADSTLGTAAYMSPEQAQGQAVDQRTDIWAFGVVLYEMLTGELPFKGEYKPALLYSVVNEDPEPPSALRSDLPAGLDEIVLKALAKDRGSRYKDAGELLADLRALGESGTKSANEKSPRAGTRRQPGTSRTPAYAAAAVLVVLLASALWRMLQPVALHADRSLAVLPFQDLSLQTGNDYFGEGITDDIITQIARIGAIHVISRSSVMRYKNSDRRLSEIAAELGVANLLQGSIRRDGDRMRITTQLIEASTENVIWAETFDRRLDDIFAVQSEVAQLIAAGLRTELSAEDQARLARAPTDNLEAYKLYLQGRFHWNRRTRADLEKAIGLFEQAVQLDSNYALGYAGLAQTYIVLANNAHAPGDSVYPKAEAYCRKAIALDPHLAEAYAALGAIQAEYRWEFAEAERTLLKAIQLNPGSSTAHHWLAERYADAGRIDLAEREITIALKLDPHSNIIRHILAEVRFAQGRYLEAIALEEQNISENPDFLLPRITLTYQYIALGDFEKALSTVNAIPNSLIRLSQRARVHAKRGNLAHAEADRDSLLSLSSKQPVFPTLLGHIYGDLGNVDEAYRWYDRAVAVRDPLMRMINLYKPDPAVQKDPRYGELMRRLGVVRE